LSSSAGALMGNRGLHLPHLVVAEHQPVLRRQPGSGNCGNCQRSLWCRRAKAASGAPDMAGDNKHDLFVTAEDGLRLHVSQYGSQRDPGLPVVGLPGLTRTTADFDALAPTLADAAGLKRQVIAIDSRGRGLSDYDSNPENYNVVVELADVVTVLTTLKIGPAIFIGSSRGGILTMLLGATRPEAIAGVVLHDIGPVIEPAGLMRIKSYVGQMPQPRTFEDGASTLRDLFAEQFPKVSEKQWLAAAHRAWRNESGELKPTYDVRLALTLADVDTEKPLPALWKEFDSLARLPMLVIRGENSNILSAATVTAMAAHHPGMQSIVVPNEGHVPILVGQLVAEISRFVACCDTLPRQKPLA
jgi:pimeloyl-ACP methyl ester carboxylesterase